MVGETEAARSETLSCPTLVGSAPGDSLCFLVRSSASLTSRQYNNKLEDNVTNVFGAKFLSTLTPVEVPLMEESESDNQGRVDEKMMPANAQGKVRPAMPDSKKDERKIWGMVSRAGEGVGRADNDRQFVYINGRPVDLPKVIMALSESVRCSPSTTHVFALEINPHITLLHLSIGCSCRLVPEIIYHGGLHESLAHILSSPLRSMKGV